MISKKNFKPLPSRVNTMCFGCSPDNPAGLHLEFFTDEESIYSWVKVPGHMCGWKDLVHGGIISTILDEVMGRSVIYKMKHFAMTKSMAVDFLKPVYVDTELKAEGRVLEIKNEREVLAEGLLFNKAGVTCAKARGLFTFFKPGDRKKLGIKDDTADLLDWFRK
ncbi:MAG: PaaI family thioesterase [Syntrophaceae bacterium]